MLTIVTTLLGLSWYVIFWPIPLWYYDAAQDPVAGLQRTAALEDRQGVIEPFQTFGGDRKICDTPNARTREGIAWI